LANRSVVLYQRIKIKNEWANRKVSEELSKLSSGEYYVSWYEGSKKQMDPVGGDPKAALAKLEKKRLELAYVAAGGEIKTSNPAPTRDSARKKVSAGVKEYLEDCDDRQGKSGYGLATRTPETYEYRLGFLIEFKPSAYLDEVDNPDFSADVNPFHRKYFMGSIGGPIIKIHAFFFGSVERVDNLSAVGAQAAAFSSDGIGAWDANQFPDSVFEKLFTFAPSGLVNQKTSSMASDYYPAVGGNYGNGWKCNDPSTFNLPCDTPVTVQGLFNQNPGITGQQYNLRYDHSFHQDNDRLYIGYFGVQQNSQYIDPRPAFNTKTPSQTYFFSAGYSHVFAQRGYVSWLKGNHSFRFGFQAQKIDYWANDAALYSRSCGTYFSDLLEMLQGQADEVSLYTTSANTGKWIGQYYGASEAQFGGCVQDDWKIRPNLRLTLGLRWDDFGNPGDYGQGASPYSNTFLGTGSTLLERAAGAYAKLVTHPFSGAQSANFLPRAAFSWSPSFARKAVLRGGLGLYQDAISLSSLTANLPTASHPHPAHLSCAAVPLSALRTPGACQFPAQIESAFVKRN
jgi:hypothetical protein